MLQFGPNIKGVTLMNIEQDVSPKAAPYLLVSPT